MLLVKFFKNPVNFIKMLIILIVLFLVLVPFLGYQFKALRFNIIRYNAHSESETREEAIKRKTFECDVKLPEQPYRISKTKIIYLKNGWIEKSWRAGFWFWTTKIDTGGSFFYQIHLDCRKGNNDTTIWNIRTEYKPNKGCDYLDDHVKTEGYFSGLIDLLPII